MKKAKLLTFFWSYDMYDSPGVQKFVNTNVTRNSVTQKHGQTHTNSASDSVSECRSGTQGSPRQYVSSPVGKDRAVGELHHNWLYLFIMPQPLTFQRRGRRFTITYGLLPGTWVVFHATL